MVCEYISYVHPTDDQNMWSMRSACGMQIDPTVSVKLIMLPKFIELFLYRSIVVLSLNDLNF